MTVVRAAALLVTARVATKSRRVDTAWALRVLPGSPALSAHADLV